jgi:hypothetical protein
MQMKLKTLGLTLVATAFMASAALAQSGTMQPIPNPPEKAKMAHHKKKAKAAAPAAEAAAAKPAEAAKPAMPAKK